jgi:hypothetical protein
MKFSFFWSDPEERSFLAHMVLNAAVVEPG